MNARFPLLPLLLVFLGALLTSSTAQVVITEIHYHPVEREAFDVNGNPVLDLSEDVHEFIEIHNAGTSAVDLAGWQLTSAVDFTFPAGTSIAPGGYRVIAKSPARIATVYGIGQSGILGPYSGKLSNSGDTVRLRNASNTIVDSVSYSASFPWAITADGLGANRDFTGIDPYTTQYKGRSLQRVSVTAGSNDPANWLASPLPGSPSPGAANAVTRTVPKPVIIGFNVLQDADESSVIRANQPARVNVTFSSTESLSNVQLEYFVENHETFTEPRASVAMSPLGNNQYTVATAIPGQANRAIVRYRIKADRGTGSEVVSPRADDPQIVPVSATTKEAWHSYFVQPVRTGTRPAYDFFISSTNANTLNTNISQSPRRVLSPDPPGYPRDDPFDGYFPPFPQYNPVNYPAAGQPKWNGTVPAVFVCNGVVYDVQTRYHGSRYRRSASLNSWKVTFPSFQLFQDKQRILITEKVSDSILGYALFHEAGLPAAYAQYVDFFKNNEAGLQRCEITDNDEETLKRYQDELKALNPQNPPKFNGLGVIYKAKGLDGDEGPYGWANGQPMPQRNVWTPLDRYIWSYPIQNNDWKGHMPFKTMMDELWTARGDRAQLGYSSNYAGQNHTNQTAVNVNIANLRAYLSENWDVDKMLTYLAVRNWMSPWDDKFHNYHVYQQGDGKWMMVPWDFDSEMAGSDVNGAAPTNSVFAGKKNDLAGTYANNSRGPNWFKDSVLRAYDAEYRQRLFTLNNTLLHPNNLQALASSLGIAAEYSSRHSGWVSSRFASVNSQVNLGTFTRPATPTHTSPANGAAVLPPTVFQTSAYSHPAGRAHKETLWEVRHSDGTYKEPIYRVKSTTNLTSLPIPFDLLNFGSTYFWRVTYFDADDRPSFTSTETSLLFGQAPVRATLLANDANTIWKYNDTSNYNDNSWTLPNFDDASWSTGAPLIGFEDGALPYPLRTALAPASRSTYYFRKRVNFPGDPSSATVKLKHVTDDGCVIYVNGVEVLRVRMPAGPVTSSTNATTGPGDAVEEGPITIPASAFVAGENVIAVEVHQVTPSSSDMVFGLSMEATLIAPSGSVVINEVMADNRSGVINGSRHPDWIELYNSSDIAVSLAGRSLSDDVLVPNKFIFPEGTTIPPFGYLVVWCDSDFTAPGLHTGFGLSSGGQMIGLFSNGTVLDNVTFGPQAADFSIGRVANGNGAFVLNRPTPGASNVAQAIGSVATLKINEWMATPVSGDDSFELYNPDALPVQIGGLYLSDTPGAPTITRIPMLSFINGKGFAEFLADGSRAGANHCDFKLSASGDSLVLTATNGSTVIDSVTFGAQSTGVSQGRLPDGGATLVSFPQSATLGESNYLPLTNIVVNEALAASPAPFEDAVELHNPSGAAADISGWWLSDDKSDLKRYQFPPGTSVPAGGFRVFYENTFNAAPGQGGSFALSSAGDELYVSAADANGNLTGYRTGVKFGGAAAGVSFGRIVTSIGSDFFPQIARTFGRDNAATVEEFRTGTGAPNAGPRIGPIIINEIMYHPPDFAGPVDNARDEFIELHNITGTTVNVGGWVLKDAVSFTFPAGTTLVPGSYVLLVTFSPSDTAALEAFRTAYGISASVPIHGPYTSKLSNSSGKIELAYPAAPVNGEIPLVLVDRVAYTDTAPWPAAPDGNGPSLQRLSRTAFGNDPVNWSSAIATPGRINPNQPPITDGDSDGDGMPDAWETANGFDPNSGTDSVQDSDGDGKSNAQEYLAGTNPRDSKSVFTSEVSRIAGGYSIRFTAMPNKSYTVQRRDSLVGGAWQKVADVLAEPAQRVVEVTDSANAEQRFYRVVTPLQP